MRRTANKIFKGRQLTIGMDLGDRWSFYCVLDESGRVLPEEKLATTPEAMKQTFARIPRSRMAMGTGTHSPWVSRVLTQLRHEVIVAHAQKVELITKSTRKDDRHDAKTLARLARIDPELLGPVRHRSAKAQIHLAVIRARAELVRARTALINGARGTDSERAATPDALLDCKPGGGTPATASHRCTSANKGTSIYERCWCRERTIFWDPLGKIVIYGAGDGSSPSEEEKTPRNER